MNTPKRGLERGTIVEIGEALLLISDRMNTDPERLADCLMYWVHRGGGDRHALKAYISGRLHERSNRNGDVEEGH